MKKVAVVGAGKIGSTIAGLLAGDYDILVIDQNPESLSNLTGETATLAVDDVDTLAAALRGCFAVINASPYHLTTVVAAAPLVPPLVATPFFQLILELMGF